MRTHVTVFTLAASSGEHNVTVWRLSVCPVGVLTVIHQGAARDAASVHFDPTLRRSDILVSCGTVVDVRYMYLTVAAKSAVYSWIFTCAHIMICSNIKTDITPTIFSRDFVAQLYCATKLQYATVHDVAQCNFGQTFGLETSVALRHWCIYFTVMHLFLDRIACTKCMRCGLLLQMSQVAWSVRFSVCVFGTRVGCAKTGEPIEMPFGVV